MKNEIAFHSLLRSITLVIEQWFPALSTPTASSASTHGHPERSEGSIPDSFIHKKSAETSADFLIANLHHYTDIIKWNGWL